MGNCFCGQPGRHYPCGYRCGSHTPARLAGLPEPDSQRYCAPKRCYCGQCPSRVSYSQTPSSFTVIDRNAMLASTGRRVSLTGYREAQQQAAHARQGDSR